MSVISAIKCGESNLFDDFDKAKNFMRYISSTYELDDDDELICARKDLSCTYKLIFLKKACCAP